MAIPVTFLITDLHRGGSPLMLAALVRGLKARGRFLPEVVSIAQLGEVAGLIEAAGVRVSSLRAEHSRDWRVVGRFVEHLRRRRPALVCSILVHANLLAALARPWWESSGEGAGVKWVQCVHTVQEKPRWHWFVQGMISGRCDAVVAPSRAILRKMAGYGVVSGGRGGGGIVIPNGIDVEKFRDAVAIPLAERRWPARAWVVGYIGRLDPVKRLGLLLRAVKGLVEGGGELRARLQVVLVGYGPEEWPLRELVKALKLENRVHFAGPTREPERWYKCFDVLCLPSAAEGFGLVLAEAAAAGIPAIACGTAAIRESVGLDGPTWVSVDPRPEEIGGAIRKVFWQRDFRPKQVDELERFSEVGMVEGYERMLSGLID